jgi:hypothetical protein
VFTERLGRHPARPAAVAAVAWAAQCPHGRPDGCAVGVRPVSGRCAAFKTWVRVFAGRAGEL